MEDNKKQQINNVLKTLNLAKENVKRVENNEINYYFVTFNPTNKPNGSTLYIYNVAQTMSEMGLNVHMTYDQTNPIPSWLSNEHKSLKHSKWSNISVNPSDVVFIPEVLVTPFFKDLEQAKKKANFEVVVISQSYNQIFYTLDIGMSWGIYGVKNVITTSEKQKNNILRFMPRLNVQVINPLIPDTFCKNDKPSLPEIAILSRDVKDAQVLIKKFYMLNPHYKWVNFNILDNIDPVSFSEDLKRYMLSIWIDYDSSFGTFPIESIKCGIPVMALLPENVPDWAEVEKTTEDGEKYMSLEESVLWYTDKDSLVVAIGGYLNKEMSDTVNPVLYENMEKLASKFTKEKFIEQVEQINPAIKESRLTFLNNIINKHQPKLEKV